MQQHIPKFFHLLLIYLLASQNNVLSIAHPQISGGGDNDRDFSALDDLNFIAMRINGTMRVLENPPDFQMGGADNIGAVETFQFLSRSSFGCILVKEIPLSEPSALQLTDDTTEESTGDLDSVSAALRKIGLSQTLYYDNSRVYTFDPPFDLDLISFFRLPEPTGAAREIVLWLEYTNPSDSSSKVHYVTFPVALSLGGVLKLEQIGGFPTLRRAAIVHSPSPDITCRVYFDNVPRTENEGVPFAPTSPFEGPSEDLLGVVCY